MPIDKGGASHRLNIGRGATSGAPPVKTYHLTSVGELETLLGSFGGDHLFRGQTKQYGDDAAPRMNTSFDRQGCIPDLMFRWTHYSRFLLAALLGRSVDDVSVEFMQALLQHYGWRSHYLDASGSPAVASWFSAHSFSSKKMIEMCEDCWENYIWLVKLAARYDFADGDGYMYVLSKSKMAQRAIKTVDLSSIELAGSRPRFHAQSAWLLGPLHGDLPSDCIVASIKAPRAVFREYAAASQIKDTFDLFPRAQDDPVLKSFLTLPWKKIEIPNDDGKIEIPAFHQALQLPEYDDSYRKSSGPHVAFYQNELAGLTVTDEALTFYTAPDDIIFGSAQKITRDFPRLTALVREAPCPVVFEIDNLVRKPGDLSGEYIKGLAVGITEAGFFWVADFAVEHFGLQAHGCGINASWHYDVDANGKWSRKPIDDDCPCGNASIHEHHLSGLTIIEAHLAEKPCPIQKLVTRPTDAI